MRRIRCRWGVAAACLGLTGALAPPAGAAPAAAAVSGGALPVLNVSGVYVAGVSSGGYMATQLQVAYSRRIRGAAVFAAGPYYCAEGSLTQALDGCTDTLLPDNLSTLESITATWSAQGLVDPVSNLSGQPVYVFHGTNDTTVRAPVTDDLVRFYRHFGASVRYDSGSPAGHAWVTPLGPNPCTVTASPFLDDCGTDPERDMLATLFGTVNPRNAGAPTGTLASFDQNRYAVTFNAASLSLAGSGFVYVPAACAAGQSCRLLVALHGCLQQAALVGTAFEDRANLDQYADTNSVVVLYPDTAASPVNPEGCFDWWGYLGPADANYAVHGGAQLESIMNMVRALGG